jgi:hypothetical protein
MINENERWNGRATEQLGPYVRKGPTPPASMTDAELVSAAMVAARLDAETFAIDVLGVSPERCRAWLAGDRPLHAAMRLLCVSIVDRPALADSIMRERIKN